MPSHRKYEIAISDDSLFRSAQDRLGSGDKGTMLDLPPNGFTRYIIKNAQLSKFLKDQISSGLEDCLRFLPDPITTDNVIIYWLNKGKQISQLIAEHMLETQVTLGFCVQLTSSTGRKVYEKTPKWHGQFPASSTMLRALAMKKEGLQ